MVLNVTSKLVPDRPYPILHFNLSSWETIDLFEAERRLNVDGHKWMIVNDIQEFDVFCMDCKKTMTYKEFVTRL